MDQPRRKRDSRVRERQQARQRRRDTVSHLPELLPSQLREAGLGAAFGRVGRRVRLWAAEVWWHLTHRAIIAQITAGVAGALVGLFILSHLLNGQIFPNVWSLGTPLGDLTVDQAAAALDQAWAQGVQIAVYADNEQIGTVTPTELGLQIDTRQVAEAARGVGLAGIPLGYEVLPEVTVDYMTAQTYLLDLTPQVEALPFNAGYEWQGVQLVGVAGREGRALDVAQTLALLQQNPINVLRRARLDVILTPIPPDAQDPTPYIEEVRQLALNPPTLIGYDPFTDTTTTWTTSSDEYVRWFEASSSGPVLRQNIVTQFAQALSDTLPAADTGSTVEQRYIDPIEAYEAMSEALLSGETTVYLRVRYARATYEVADNDTGFRIARHTGLPFFEVIQSNPNIDFSQDFLYIGQHISLPSRDVTMPEMPVPNKRIIVDLDNYMLYAFENRQLVFSWSIATGMPNAPTSPGIYQILNHDEVAYGSSNTLCDAAGVVCGQWEMSWFMGIYEVAPGLINGFHGMVRLPNGGILNEGAVGRPGTFGCVMSVDIDAQQLYDWAEVGTVVEIVSSEFAPMSDLARMVIPRES